LWIADVGDVLFTVHGEAMNFGVEGVADLAGGAARPVTPPDLQVREVLSVGGDTVLFSASAQDPTRVGVWRYDPGGLAAVRATTGSADGEPGLGWATQGGGTTVLTSRSMAEPGVTTTVLRGTRPVATIASLAERPVLPALRVELLRVRVEKPMPRRRIEPRAPAGADAARAKTGTRNVLWGSSRGEAALYRWEALEPGNRVAGCAILESANTTYLVPEGWTLEIDGYGDARAERG
jgi:hypothetical protein